MALLGYTVRISSSEFSYNIQQIIFFRDKQFVSIKVSKSAVQYKEASEDEIEILSAVSYSY